MTQARHIAVIDIGKTNAKLALVDLETLSEIAVLTRPNTVCPGPPWPHFDTEGHWAFLLDGLRQFHQSHGIDAISTTTHGASIVLLDAKGDLAAPILDYEHDGPMKTAAQYDALRPPFAQTGSPRLSNGLNVGAQLHWQFQADPDLHVRTTHILTYPQYWGHRLTGVIASDVTSIGCHTDLWVPADGQFSDLVETLDIADKMAPVRKSTEVLGPILPQIAAETGLPVDTPVLCGIHDSNASLYPHILMQDAPFSVVSTGTWVIVMSVGDTRMQLDPSRDTLVNVNALGDAVPSARFMGGREFEVIQQGCPVQTTPDDIAAVLNSEVMLLPAVIPSTGPYQGRNMTWRGPEPPVASGARAVALSFYLALMTGTCLRLTGAAGPIIVEGPFAANDQYLAMLAAATDRPVLQSSSATGTSIGAALLFGSAHRLAAPETVPNPQHVARLRAYAARWRALVDQPEN
ncbi:FGGY-family carbohydrate kinase [Tateyamaria pelophila]|uniref:FGGY-family carbohydrate kinase n=1 Tax=Tateyamaria pelophila TaxID=328415 RepID=UPI001CBCAAE4|nr:FGGY-family carbohydrate kinase [Tateyamaria pelophila]